MDMMRTVAPSHQSYQNHHQSQHHPWMWVQLTVGKLRIPPRTTALSTRRTSQDQYTGPLTWLKLSIQKAKLNEFICCPVHPRSLHLARWKGNWRWKCPFQKKWGVSQHVCEAYWQKISGTKDIPGPSIKD